MIPIGDRLKALRESKGITQSELSEITGISNVYISNVENSKKTNPSGDVLSKLATALGVSVDEFYRTNAEIKKSEDLSPDFKELLDSAKKLTPSQLNLIKNIIKEFQK